MNKYIKYASIFSILALTACSSNRELHTKLVENVKAHNYPEALKIVNDENFYNEEKNRLLKAIETASTNYHVGNYYQALQSFDKAKNLSDELYTKSISAKIASILNDNSSEFSGNIYERSQIRLYQALCHYNLAVTGKYEAFNKIDENGKSVNVPEKVLSDKEKQNHMNATRNIMKEWHSLFAQYQNETSGKATYKYDLMQALFGAFLYTQTGSSTDRQIALGLYKEAKEALFYNYNIYPAFNEKYEEFVDNYSDFKNMDIEKIKAEYVKPTKYALDLEKFIDFKINQLSDGKDDNLFLLVKEGFIADKVAKEYKLDLKTEDLLALTYLSRVLANASKSNPNDTDVDKKAFTTFATLYLLNNVSYELPSIEDRALLDIKGELVDNNNNKIIDLPIILTSPLSNIAYKDISDNIVAEKAKLITKLTAEYVTAAAISYIAYKAVKTENNNEFLAILSGVGMFKGLATAIRATNKADIRQWKLLPNNIYISSVNVPDGKYTIRIYVNDGKRNTPLFSKDIEIKKDKTFVDINI